VLDRNVENLSGGELQRFAIAVVAAQQADVYMIDEPSSYLDVRQRLKAAKVRAGDGDQGRQAAVQQGDQLSSSSARVIDGLRHL
jgi:translation initiation factor RLI1